MYSNLNIGGLVMPKSKKLKELIKRLNKVKEEYGREIRSDERTLPEHESALALLDSLAGQFKTTQLDKNLQYGSIKPIEPYLAEIKALEPIIKKTLNLENNQYLGKFKRDKTSIKKIKENIGEGMEKAILKTNSEYRALEALMNKEAFILQATPKSLKKTSRSYQSDELKSEVQLRIKNELNKVSDLKSAVERGNPIPADDFQSTLGIITKAPEIINNAQELANKAKTDPDTKHILTQIDQFSPLLDPDKGFGSPKLIGRAQNFRNEIFNSIKTSPVSSPAQIRRALGVKPAATKAEVQSENSGANPVKSKQHLPTYAKPTSSVTTTSTTTTTTILLSKNQSKLMKTNKRKRRKRSL